MSDKRITDLPAVSKYTDGAIPIVDVSAAQLKSITKANLVGSRFYPLATPLTNSNWNGGVGLSTTASTVLDLSALFGVPPGIKAITVRLGARDSVAYPSAVPVFTMGGDSGYNWALAIYPLGGDIWTSLGGICPCDVNGDIWYTCTASGVATLDIILQISGYWL